jgi:hypothetical protein
LLQRQWTGLDPSKSTTRRIAIFLLLTTTIYSRNLMNTWSRSRFVPMRKFKIEQKKTFEKKSIILQRRNIRFKAPVWSLRKPMRKGAFVENYRYPALLLISKLHAFESG